MRGRTNRLRLQGQVALITGASGGQGLAEARLFAEHGAAVMLCDVVDEAGRRLARALSREGMRATYFTHVPYKGGGPAITAIIAVKLRSAFTRLRRPRSTCAPAGSTLWRPPACSFTPAPRLSA